MRIAVGSIERTHLTDTIVKDLSDRGYEILEAWFRTSYQPNPEDDGYLAPVSELERDYGKPREV